MKSCKAVDVYLNLINTIVKAILKMLVNVGDIYQLKQTYFLIISKKSSSEAYKTILKTLEKIPVYVIVIYIIG